MITRQVLAKLVAFVVVSVVATGVLLVRYVGWDPARSDYRVTVALSDASGLFEGSEVTYRGVQVGEVSDLEVTDAGTDVVLRIRGDAPALPADASVRVANRSAIGEQYLDLRGPDAPDDRTAVPAGSTDGGSEERADTGSAGVLGDGDRIDATRDASLPPAFDAVLRSGRDFVASVPEDSLRVVVDEAFLASRGVGPEIAQIVDTSLEWVETAEGSFRETVTLIDNAETVLGTQVASGDAIRSFSSDLGLIAETLRSSDGDLRTLFETVTPAAAQIQQLVAEVGQPLGVLMGNLVTPAQVFGVNAPAVQDLMERLPDAVTTGWVVTAGGSLQLSLVPNFANPLPCVSGYEGTERRPGLDTSTSGFDTSAGCDLAPSSGTNVRGPGAVPPTSAATAAAPAAGAAAAAVPTDVAVRDATTLADLLGGTDR